MTPGAVGKDPGRIRRMFAGIARRYDLLNHLLSLNADRRWRRRAARALRPAPGERILDLCTGTADLALEIARAAGEGARASTALAGGGAAAGPALVVGADFCPEMVRIGERKRRAIAAGGGGAGARSTRLVVADALRLPFRDGAFDAASAAFGLRNLRDVDAGLAEAVRVLRPGGRAAILEFARPPRSWFGAAFGLYFRHVLPIVGRWISRAADPEARDAYRYLPASVGDFPDPVSLAAALERAGLGDVGFSRLSGGIACLHIGRRTGLEASGPEGAEAEGSPAAPLPTEVPPPAAAPPAAVPLPAAGTAPPARWAVVLEPLSPRPAFDMARALAGRLGLHPLDAVAMTTSGGILAADLPVAAAGEVVERLAGIGVGARRVDSGLLRGLPVRAVRVRSIEFREDGATALLRSRAKVEIPPGAVLALHLHALAREAPGTGTAEDSEPGAPSLLSPGGERLRDALRAAGDPNLAVTVFPAGPLPPLRLTRDEIDYSPLGPRMMRHSLDNFLVILRDLRAFAPGAWLGDRVDRLLETLDPAEILYSRSAEVQNFERWMQVWMRVQER